MQAARATVSEENGGKEEDGTDKTSVVLDAVLAAVDTHGNNNVSCEQANSPVSESDQNNTRDDQEQEKSQNISVGAEELLVDVQCVQAIVEGEVDTSDERNGDNGDVDTEPVLKAGDLVGLVTNISAGCVQEDEQAGNESKSSGTLVLEPVPSEGENAVKEEVLLQLLGGLGVVLSQENCLNSNSENPEDTKGGRARVESGVSNLKEVTRRNTQD